MAEDQTATRDARQPEATAESVLSPCLAGKEEAPAGPGITKPGLAHPLRPVVPRRVAEKASDRSHAHRHAPNITGATGKPRRQPLTAAPPALHNHHRRHTLGRPCLARLLGSLKELFKSTVRGMQARNWRLSAP